MWHTTTCIGFSRSRKCCDSQTLSPGQMYIEKCLQITLILYKSYYSLHLYTATEQLPNVGIFGVSSSAVILYDSTAMKNKIVLTYPKLVFWKILTGLHH